MAENNKEVRGSTWTARPIMAFTHAQRTIAKIKKFIFRPKFVYGKIKTEMELANELMRLQERAIRKAIRRREYEDGADDVLFNMLDVANFSIISATINWTLGRMERSPIDTLLKSIEQRKHFKKHGKPRDMLIRQWLENHNIDKSYLERIVQQVADSKTNNQTKNMTDEMNQPTAEAPENEAPAEENTPEAEAPSEAPAEEAPAEAPADGADAEAPAEEASEEAPAEETEESEEPQA